MDIIKKYFPLLTDKQEMQLLALHDLYTDWNTKINLISRKDIENLYEKHILHSLGIAKVINFKDNSTILDVGTGGGLPGIPLAILFPNVQFLLIDSIGKKIKATENIVQQIGLTNIKCKQERVEDENNKFDFIVSRAVMPLSDLVKVAKKNIAKEQHNAFPNGFICLKGGDLQAELNIFRKKVIIYNLDDYFEEEFFRTKKVVFLPNF
ncbi:MAG: 16S rRNA (guanine(527)-N(7))-methyltransferase RsmG [Dysgonamonadaceae bacterium]|jgi:16S rRNA (guanine527-N7)-methyltransferase|nr:16S rRNA (guanine(527)-N(7))-methyltransferase RsmG [Dysgonamonadaceae bacterium]